MHMDSFEYDIFNLELEIECSDFYQHGLCNIEASGPYRTFHVKEDFYCSVLGCVPIGSMIFFLYRIFIVFRLYHHSFIILYNATWWCYLAREHIQGT